MALLRQILIRLPEFAVLTLHCLQPFRHLSANAGASAAIDLLLLDPHIERIRRAADLRGNKETAVHRGRSSFSGSKTSRTARAHASGENLFAVLLAIAPPFSRFGASGKPRAVHRGLRARESQSLFDQRHGFLEARMPRGLKPLKHDHLHRDDFCTRPSHPLKCDLLAFEAARAYGVADDKDTPAGLDKREHRLQYAHVRLPSADDRLAPGCQALEEAGRAYGAERHLAQDRRRIRSELGDGWPEALRVLFGEQNGRTDEPRGVDKAPRIGDRRGRLVDCRHELRLEVDEKKHRGLWAHHWHGHPSLILAGRNTFIRTQSEATLCAWRKPTLVG